MVYKKIQNEQGDYKDSNQARYAVLEAHEAWTPEGINAGWSEFENLEACLSAWGLAYAPLAKDEADYESTSN